MCFEQNCIEILQQASVDESFLEHLSIMAMSIYKICIIGKPDNPQLMYGK